MKKKNVFTSNFIFIHGTTLLYGFCSTVQYTGRQRWLAQRAAAMHLRMYVLRFSRMEYACAPLNTEQIIFETVEKLKLVLKHIVLCTAFSRMEYACAPLNTEQILCETVKKLKMVKINHFTICPFIHLYEQQIVWYTLLCICACMYCVFREWSTPAHR